MINVQIASRYDTNKQQFEPVEDIDIVNNEKSERPRITGLLLKRKGKRIDQNIAARSRRR